MSFKERLDALEQYFRETLRIKIEAISKECTGLAWKSEIEFDLWAMLTERRSNSFGIRDVTTAQLEELHRLAKLVEGWWMFEKEEKRFVTLEEWRARYDSQKRGNHQGKEGESSMATPVK